MVALPKKWIREMGLRQGDEITITRPSNCSLLITAGPSPVKADKDDAIIECGEKDTPLAIMRKVIAVYSMGYNSFSLVSTGDSFPRKQSEAIKDLARKTLLGAEIIDDTRNRISLQVFVNNTDLHADNDLKRILAIASAMHQDAAVALEKFDKSLASEICDRDAEVDRFTLFLIRKLKTSINGGVYEDTVLEPQDLLDYTQVARTLERFAECARDISQVVIESTLPLERSLLERILRMDRFSMQLFDEAFLSLFKKDYKSAGELTEKAKAYGEMEKEIEAVMKEIIVPDFRQPTALLMNSIRKTVEYSVEIAELVLNRSVENAIKISKLEING